jgi:hypothetical protein
MGDLCIYFVSLNYRTPLSVGWYTPPYKLFQIAIPHTYHRAICNIQSNIYLIVSCLHSLNLCLHIFTNRCPADPNAGILSQAANETIFYFQVFVYADHPGSIYVHCDAKLCKSDDITLACEPVCNH